MRRNAVEDQEGWINVVHKPSDMDLEEEIIKLKKEVKKLKNGKSN